jgi:hypothetical protein
MEIIKLFKNADGQWMSQLKGKVEPIEALLTKLGLADEGKLKELFGDKMPQFDFSDEPDANVKKVVGMIQQILEKYLNKDAAGNLGLGGLAGKLGSLFGK